jgi:BirA family biotin operon repressor/biotin-[acetyl-CoA-carboxylase] ligase
MTSGAAILGRLYGAAGQFVSRDQLRRVTGLADAVIEAELRELRRLAYGIESHPHFGCRLVSAPDRLTADDLTARLSLLPSDTGPRIIGSEIIVFERTASTNDVVLRLAAAGRPEGLTVFAEEQTAGRGRQGRVWVSPPRKGLWFSVLLRPAVNDNTATRVTLAASVAVARVLSRSCGMEARIKWPNDVTVGGRKLAGILTETRSLAATGNGASAPPVAVLGVGVDVNCAREDFPAALAGAATSLWIETGRLQDRPALAAHLLAALDDAWRQARERFDAVIADWARLSTTLGKHVAVRAGPHQVEGFAQALDASGALLVRRDNGRVERLLGGDLVIERE